MPAVTDIAENSVLLFDGDTASKKLVDDIADGKVPIYCNVLYDTSGALPAVTVFDPDQIVQIYNRLSEMTVDGASEMGVTDSYHHVFFALQNGTMASFSFEGAELLDKGGKNYAVRGGEDLWKMVRQIQDDYLARVEKKGTRPITVVGEKDLIDSCPTEAVPGDMVCVSAFMVTDVSMHVAANGVEAENWGDRYFLFTMPDQDVKVKAYVTSPPDSNLA